MVIRRITALCLGLLLANLTWVGSGYACVMPAMTHATQASTMKADSTGEAMAAMDMSATLSSAADTAPQHREQPCRLPWAPDGCQSIAPCAPLAIASYAFALDTPNVTPVRIADLSVLTPPSELRAPDLPPPRA